MELPKGKKSKLEKLEQKLYSIDGIVSKERPELKPKRYNVGDDWKKEFDINDVNYIPKKKLGFFAVVMILAALFFVGSLSYAGYILFFNQKNSLANDVDIKIVGPVSVGAGQELSIDAIVTNNNKIPIELVNLFVEYPDGSKNPQNLSEDLKRVNVVMGDLPSGSIKRETVRVALLGEQNTNQKIDFLVQYRVAGSNAVFEKKKDFEIALNATPVYLTVSGLKEISSGQDLELTLNLKSNATQPLENVMVLAEYPFGFQFKDSDIKPKIDNNIWIFDQFKPGEEKTFKVKGVIQGQNEEDRVFRFNAGLLKENTNDQMGVLFTLNTYTVSIAKSFVDLVIDINKNKENVVAVESGKTNDSLVTFTNNTNDLIKDLEIDLKLVGSVLDKNSINVGSGFYRSVDNMIVWNKESQKIFLELLPKKSVSVSLKFNTLELYSGRNSIKNPQIDISAKVSGKRLASQDKEQEISFDLFKTIKVISDTPAFANTYYEQGPFSNIGPIPPKVDTPTTYTIEWNVSNSSNDLENVQMTGVLPSYVSWKNIISPTSEKISYDPITRQITWDIGNIPAGTGYTNNAKQVFMKVEFLPSISQKGSNPILINNVLLTAKDTFTGTNISRSVPSPKTSITGRGIADGHQNVVE